MGFEPGKSIDSQHITTLTTELYTKLRYQYASIYLPLGSKPVGVDFVAIDFSRHILLWWCYLHPTTSRLFVSGLGLAQVPFLVPVARFRGVHEAEISMQISAHAGA